MGRHQAHAFEFGALVNGNGAELPAVIAEAKAHARASGLIYVDDREPGIRRVRHGKSFRYLDPEGHAVRDEPTLDRIRKLAIPPAYTDVWICLRERGHLQATGRDARGRKQYRYHPDWRATRDEGKFSRMIGFAEALPKLRRQLQKDLKLDGLPKAKVLAVVVTLLDETLIRVGNEEYARTNQSYGLTTLRDRHVKFLRDGRATFAFRGKSGRPHEVTLDDRRLARLIRRCQQLPGQQLFQYVDDEGQRQPIDSGLVNEYLHDAMSSGEESFTAKDFRTWGGTLRAIAHLAQQSCDPNLSDAAFKRCIAATAREVASTLGNTAAVCRKSYINPIVFTAWREGLLHQHIPQRALSPKQLEKMALSLLRAHERRAKAKAKATRTTNPKRASSRRTSAAVRSTATAHVAVA
jgi:DNA topoisomerase IB